MNINWAQNKYTSIVRMKWESVTCTSTRNISSTIFTQLTWSNTICNGRQNYHEMPQNTFLHYNCLIFHFTSHGWACDLEDR